VPGEDGAEGVDVVASSEMLEQDSTSSLPGKASQQSDDSSSAWISSASAKGLKMYLSIVTTKGFLYIAKICGCDFRIQQKETRESRIYCKKILKFKTKNKTFFWEKKELNPARLSPPLSYPVPQIHHSSATPGRFWLKLYRINYLGVIDQSL
jgi:hypothetical protein